MGRIGCCGVPLTQVSLVHWLPSSAGTSELSTVLTGFPEPSQTFEWQSPGVDGTTVPPGKLLMLHVCVTTWQVADWHAVMRPAQSPSLLHCTQFPEPSQIVPPPSLHGVPGPALLMPHVLLWQVRWWHWVSVPGHCEALLHCTHCPLLPQTCPPF
jgi:hypothetical protein